MPGSDAGGPGFTVSLRDVYDQLVRLTGEVRGMAGQRETLSDHEQRIRGLERWRYALPVALVSAGGSVVITIVLAVWKG